jgi:hypothetical protein
MYLRQCSSKLTIDFVRTPSSGSLYFSYSWLGVQTTWSKGMSRAYYGHLAIGHEDAARAKLNARSGV